MAASYLAASSWFALVDVHEHAFDVYRMLGKAGCGTSPTCLPDVLGVHHGEVMGG
jgi:hypothetical protein